MQLTLLAQTTLPLEPQLHWILYSNQTHSFITGDGRKAFSLPLSDPGTASELTPARPFDDRIPPSHPCNLPIPMSMYDELATVRWHGFQFLDHQGYSLSGDDGLPPDGDLLRTLVFGPNYGHLLLHPFSGMILRLHSSAMELLTRSSTALHTVAKTRTRGSAVLTFAAHPTETLIAYGDNSGNFHAHQFDATGFGKTSKIVGKERKASSIQFVQNGTVLAIAGMGYLATFSYAAGKFTPLHEVSMAVRDFIWTAEDKTLYLNQGLHGVSAYRYDEDGFAKIGAVGVQGAARFMAVSECGGYLGIIGEGSATIHIYAVSID